MSGFTPSRNERLVSFERLREQPDDPDPEYRWMIDVIFSWCMDEDSLPRLEHGHGSTRDEACDMACRVAAAFMAEYEPIAPGEWPDNGIDTRDFAGRPGQE